MTEKNEGEAQTAGRSKATSVRLAIYFHRGEFEDAKAAYLADWRDLADPPETFAGWISASVLRHAGRAVEERGGLAGERGAGGGGSGVSRTFTVPESTLLAVWDALEDDRDIDRWLSVGAFCGDAVAVAVQDARHRVGGELPTPPARLPSHLTRKNR